MKVSPLARSHIGVTLVALAFVFWSAPAANAFDQRWYVTEDLNTHTCYRVTSPSDENNWRTLGVFNTFREAGMWAWGHRNICERSPIFS